MTKGMRLLTGLLLIFWSGAPGRAVVPLVVSKSQATVWDPIDLAVLPKAVPGAQVDYTISVTNPLTQFAVAKAVSVSDQIPAGTKLYVGNLDSTSGGPVVFSAIVTSSLGYSYLGLASSVDNLEFSNNGGTSWGYMPSADASGCDPAVTNIRVSVTGNQAAAETFTIRFRTIVK